MNISEFMANHHHECDENYVEAESLVAQSKLDEASPVFTQAYDNFAKHFEWEESTLFPAFEDKTGMNAGPTQVMRMEHERIKQILEELKGYLQDNNKDKFLGLSESFMILVQQHNMKEEQMLYAMMDRVFGAESDALVEKLNS